VAAVQLFSETYPDVNLIALVDFENDSIRTSLECAHALGDRLWGVRHDTSGTMVDRAIVDEMGSFDPTGVNPRLVEKTRRALDAAGFAHVRIIVSGGFNPAKIAAFEKKGVPVDAYGVGSSLFDGKYDFTADIVLRDGRPCAKVGREFAANDRLAVV
jgi:nicotinate phosphoribosyltransferase